MGEPLIANAVEVAAGLPNARHLVIEGASHDLFRRPEVLRDLIAFFRESGYPPTSTIRRP